MMHDNEIRSRLGSVQHAVSLAAQALSAERFLPGELRDYIQKLDRRADTIGEIMATQDYESVPKLVDDMEILSARARRVCSSGLPLTPQIKMAVNQMHSELFDFKQHLH